MITFLQWLKLREAGVGVPYVGQKPGQGTWQGAAGGGKLSSVGDVKPLNKKKYIESKVIEESITKLVINQVMDYLHRNSHYDDPIDMKPLALQLGLNGLEIQRIIGLINQHMAKEAKNDPVKEPWDHGEYIFDIRNMVASLSSADI